MYCLQRLFTWTAFALVISVVLFNLSFANEERSTTPPDWDPVMGAPHGPSEWEKANESYDLFDVPTDDPPPAPVVQPAEWEPMTGVLIRYPLGLPTSLVAEMSENVTIVTIVSGTSQQNSATSQYQSAGVNMANCEWLIAPSNSMWTRDYGPWFIFTGNDEQGITDHIYNRPYRPDDNEIPWEFGAEYNIPVYGMPVIHTGGNYMTDGMSVAMSTNLVYNENPGMTQAQVDMKLFEYCGIEDYDVVTDILSGGIHHIDCWAKMLSPGKILAKRLSPPNSTLEANVAYWESKMSSYGKPYEVIRVDCFSSTPYTNSLIVNNKVFVPLFNGSLDDEAMQTYQEAMPGYEILGYTGSWVSNDAIHCRAMGITDRYMLRIVHVPLLDRENNGQDYPVEADIHAYSNQALAPGSPEILWRLEGGNYSSASMAYQGDDVYLGYIPAQPDYSVVEYYLHAEDETGRRENHPYIGAPDPHSFMVVPAGYVPDMSVALTYNYGSPVPAGGGFINFDVFLQNNETSSINFDLWIEIPPQVTPPSVPNRNLTFPGGFSITRPGMNWPIPASWPAGNYDMVWNIGELAITTAWATDSFSFSKSADDDGSGYTLWEVEGDPLDQLFEGVDIAESNILNEFILHGNYPNPFNPTTTINYQLSSISHVTLDVYDLTGRMVAQLVDGTREAGQHEVTFDASDLSSGVYIYQLEAGDYHAIGKMVLMK